MSLFNPTPQVQAILRGGNIEECEIADVYLDGEILHYSNMFHPFTLDDGIEPPVTYLPLGTRLIPPSSTTETQSLDDTDIELNLDSSRITDPADPIGALVDNNLSQRRVRLRKVMFVPDTGRTQPLWVYDVRSGVIDRKGDVIQDDAESILGLNIRSGAFAVLERRNWTFTDSDQRELYPNDTSMQHQAALSDRILDWRGDSRQ